MLIWQGKCFLFSFELLHYEKHICFVYVCISVGLGLTVYIVQIFFCQQKEIYYLQANFKCKNSCKKIICKSQVDVSRAVLVNWILRCKRNTGHQDDEHDEVVEELLGDEPMNHLPHPIIKI